MPAVYLLPEPHDSTSTEAALAAALSTALLPRSAWAPAARTPQVLTSQCREASWRAPELPSQPSASWRPSSQEESYTAWYDLPRRAAVTSGSWNGSASTCTWGARLQQEAVAQYAMQSLPAEKQAAGTAAGRLLDVYA